MFFVSLCVRCGCNEHQKSTIKIVLFSFSATACKLSFVAFRNPIAIVFYIVILEIYKIYNFVAILTAF